MTSHLTPAQSAQCETFLNNLQARVGEAIFWSGSVEQLVAGKYEVGRGTN